MSEMLILAFKSWRQRTQSGDMVLHQIMPPAGSWLILSTVLRTWHQVQSWNKQEFLRGRFSGLDPSSWRPACLAWSWRNSGSLAEQHVTDLEPGGYRLQWEDESREPQHYMQKDLGLWERA